MKEYPAQTYWPGCKATLVIRFEEFGQGGAPEPPAIPAQLRKGVKPVIDKLTIKTDDQGRLELEAPTMAAGGPQKQVSSADGRTQVIAGIIPTSASWARNGVREADTLELTFNYLDMPIDPRVVRACAVEFYLGSFSEEEFARGIGGQAPEQVRGGSVPLNILSDDFVDSSGQLRTNLRFQGWVDHWDTEWGEDNAPSVRLACTDNTRLLIEQEAPPALQVKADELLDRAIADYLSNFPQFVGFLVEYRPAGVDPPRLKDVLSPTANAKGFGPPPAGGAGGGQGGGKLSVWDYLTDVAGSVGHIVRVEGRSVVIQRARTLYAEGFIRSDDPFVGRILPSGRELRRRLFVYGRNLATLRIARKYARNAPFNVECRCYSPKRKKTLIARYPSKDKRQKRVNPGEAADQSWKVITIYGIDDEKTLRAIAQEVYEGLGRNELEIELSTRDMASFGGDYRDPDVLDMLPGDAIDIEINREPDPAASSIIGVEETIATRAGQFLVDLGYSPEFAAAYAKAVANLGYPTTFRVRAVTVDWDLNDSVSIGVECINYIEARADAELPEGEEPNAAASAGASPTKVVVEADQ